MSDRMKRIYVAGAYNSSNILGCLNNMRRGMRLAYDVLKAGFAPFTPWFDYHFALIGEMTVEEYHAFSMAWLEASDAVIVVKENAEQSRGTQAELARAKELGIPVFWDLQDLQKWHDENFL